MSLLKRISLAVSASVDRLVGEIENHDAVIEAGICESRRLYARAAVRHARMREEGERLKRRLDGLRADAAAWRARALACAETPEGEGEERALECLRRARRAGAEAESLERTWQRHTDLEGRLAQEIAALRRRVDDLEHRRLLLRSREATAEAAVRIRTTETDTPFDLDETFERWEIRVTEAEIETDLAARSGAPGDGFEARFAAEEERAALREELAALRRRQPAEGLGAAALATGTDREQGHDR